MLLGCCLAGAFLVGVIWVTPLLGNACGGLDRSFEDRLSRLKGGDDDADLLFLGIDEKSLSLSSLGPEAIGADENLVRMQDRFPWDRRVYAEAITRLLDAGAETVIVDLLFTEPSDDPAEDEALAAVLAANRDRVILASIFAPAFQNELTYVEPLFEFTGPIDGGGRIGYVNFWPHPEDGMVRGGTYERTLREVHGEKAHADEEVYRSLAGAALRGEVPQGRQQIAFSTAGRAAYPPVSFYKVFTGDSAIFEGKTVMIGPAAERFQDQHATPVGLLFGPQLHLEMLAAARAGAFYHTDEAHLWLWFFLGTLLATLVVLFVKRPWLVFVGCLASAGFLLLLALGLAYYYILSPVLIGLASITLIFFISQAACLMSEARRREGLRRQLQRSVSPNVAAALMAAPNGYLDAARGEKRQVAVLFSDIRNFTELAERLDAAALVSQLNEYFAEMTEAVFAHGGTLDKFIGDAVMASWGGIRDFTSAELARSSVTAAQEMISRLAVLNARWREEERPTFEVGIGIHIGDAIAGEVGSQSRADFTVLGDAVNLASRIESFTRQIGLSLLVSRDVAQELEFPSASLGMFLLKGRSRAIDIFAPGAQLSESFVKGRAAVEAGDLVEARAHFENAPASRLSQLYLDQLPDWRGVITVREK